LPAVRALTAGWLGELDTIAWLCAFASSSGLSAAWRQFVPAL